VSKAFGGWGAGPAPLELAAPHQPGPRVILIDRPDAPQTTLRLAFDASLAGSEAVYIVFLDPGLHSTLGPLTADKHYMAYHGFFNVSGGRVHYAVVPFQQNSKAQFQAGLRTLTVAALHSAEEVRN